MKTFKYLTYAFAAVLASAMSACSVSEPYVPGEQPDGAQIYFSSETPTEYDLEEDVTSITIKVMRVNADEQKEVEILADIDASEASLFTFPSSVSFSSGEKEADYVISFKRDQMTDGTEYKINLLINDPDNTTPYGLSTIGITLTPWPWQLLGTGKYRDDWFTSMWSVDPGVEVDVKIYESKSTKGLYMVEDMFGWNFLTAFFEGTQSQILGAGYIKSYTPTNITFDCTDPDNVIVPLQKTGIVDGSSNNLGELCIALLQGGIGTLKDGAITFSTGSLFMGNEEMYGATANNSGLFRVLLPGAEVSDYSLSAEYAGMRVEADNETASAVIDFTYGADVAGISYAFILGEKTEEETQGYIQGIVDGTLENVQTISELDSDGGSISVEARLDAGFYTLVAVPSDASGEAVAESATSYAFYFPAMEGAIPDCDIKCALYPVSEYPDAADYVSQCPDQTSIVYEMSGSNIKSLTGTLISTSALDAALSYGFTVEEVMAANGMDFSKMIETINSGEKYWDIFINLDSGAPYTLLVSAENTYGKKATARFDITTATYPYSGTLKTGNYRMTCTIAGGASDGSDFTSENILTIVPTQDNDTEFVVSNLGANNGMSWNAKYDPSASTLTLDGTMLGLESKGSMFGGWVTGDYLSAYAVVSYFDDSAQDVIDDPVVFKVDQSGKLSELTTNVEIMFGTLSGNQVSPVGTVAVFHTGITSIAEYTESTSAARRSSVRTDIQLPQRNLLQGGLCFRNTEPYLTMGIVPGPDDETLKTLDVESNVCEPLAENGTLHMHTQSTAAFSFMK